MNPLTPEDMVTPARRAGRILLVEDNPDDALLVSALLAQTGLADDAVVHVQRLSDALSALGRHDYDCVLLDLSLPDAEGMSALMAMLEEAVGVPIVVLTGIDDDTTALDALRRGAQDFLVKGKVNGPALWRVVNYAAQRHAATETLRRSELRFARAFDDGPYGMAIVSAGESPGRFVQVNRALCRMLGRTSEDLVGRTFHELTHPDDVGDSGASFDALLDTNAPKVELEKRYIHADGSTVHAIVSASVMDEGEDGPPLYVISQMRDITEKVRTRSENARLEQILQQTQRMETVGQLAGGVAHDFNNLLSIIRNYAQFAIESIDDEVVVEDLTEVVHAADQAAALTEQLLVFGRRDRTTPSVIDLRAAIAEAQPLLRRTLSEDIALVVDCACAPHVLIDRSQFDQVLLNIVVNARDAMPDGGRIRIGTGESHVDGKAMAVLTVEDSGCGMTPELQAKIFDPFFTTKDGSGTGLGLATTYGIVTRAGGTIVVDSELGRGTTFTICLPMADGTPAHDASPADRSVPRPATVLVVEDSDGVRRLTERILEDAGYSVSCARDGEHALEVLAGLDAAPDVVVTDVVMPRLGGAVLAERLAEEHPSTGIVFVSGYTARPDHLPLDARLVTKPLMPEELLSHVASLVEHRHA